MNFLAKPFPTFRKPQQVLRSALLFGAFVALFLGIFQPFGLAGLKEKLWLVVAGYGVITAVCILLVKWLTSVFFPNFYREEHWTTGREIIQTMANVVLIAVANWIFSWIMEFFHPTWWSFIVFLGFTISVGILPVSIQVLLRQNIYQSKYSQSSEQINEQLLAKTFERDVSRMVRIVDENGKTVLESDPEKIVAAVSADNYVKIYFLNENEYSTEMIRTALGTLENTLANEGQFFRTHRFWLVNLRAVNKVTGNARGYMLRLQNFQTEIPVSRSRITDFNAVFGSH